MNERDVRVDWHGWKIADGLQIHIGRLPKRTHPVLYVAEHNEFCAQITPLASFRNEACAREAQAILDGWADRMNAMERELRELRARPAP